MSVQLQFRVVGRGRDQRTRPDEAVEQRLSQCRALRRVGPGAQFVEQHQAPRPGSFYHPDDGTQVAAEGGQRLGDRLLVPDVGEDITQHRQLRTGSGRHVKPGLMHQAQQAQRAQGDRLAARVGPGDHQGRVAVAEADVYRHHTAGQAGVARAEQDYLRPLGDLGGGRIHLLGQSGLGGPEVEAGQGIQRLPERAGLRGHLGRQLIQNALDLGPLRNLRLAPGVAQLHGHQRLHEQGLPAARGIVNDALDMAARLRLDRDHVAPAAQRHQRLLEGARNLTRVHQLIQPGAEPLIGHSDGPTQPSQPGRRGVQHLAGRVEAPLQDTSQGGQAVDLPAQISHDRPPIPADCLGQAGGRLQRVHDVEEMGRLEAAAACRTFDPGADVLAAADAGPRVLGDERPGLRCLFESSGHHYGVRRGLHRLSQAPPGREARGRGQAGSDQRELEQGLGSPIHRLVPAHRASPSTAEKRRGMLSQGSGA